MIQQDTATQADSRGRYEYSEGDGHAGCHVSQLSSLQLQLYEMQNDPFYSLDGIHYCVHL